MDDLITADYSYPSLALVPELLQPRISTGGWIYDTLRCMQFRGQSLVPDGPIEKIFVCDARHQQRLQDHVLRNTVEHLAVGECKHSLYSKKATSFVRLSDITHITLAASDAELSAVFQIEAIGVYNNTVRYTSDEVMICDGQMNHNQLPHPDIHGQLYGTSDEPAVWVKNLKEHNNVFNSRVGDEVAEFAYIVRNVSTEGGVYEHEDVQAAYRTKHFDARLRALLWYHRSKLKPNEKQEINMQPDVKDHGIEEFIPFDSIDTLKLETRDGVKEIFIHSKDGEVSAAKTAFVFDQKVSLSRIIDRIPNSAMKDLVLSKWNTEITIATVGSDQNEHKLVFAWHRINSSLTLSEVPAFKRLADFDKRWDDLVAKAIEEVPTVTTQTNTETVEIPKWFTYLERLAHYAEMGLLRKAEYYIDFDDGVAVFEGVVKGRGLAVTTQTTTQEWYEMVQELSYVCIKFTEAGFPFTVNCIGNVVLEGKELMMNFHHKSDEALCKAMSEFSDDAAYGR